MGAAALQESHRVFSRLVFDPLPNADIDHLVPMILVEYDGRLGVDGAEDPYE